MLNVQQSIFLDIVQSFITKQNPTLRNANWPELYIIAKKQALSGLLGYYLGRVPEARCPTNLAIQLKNDYYANIAQSVLQENAYENLSIILNDNCIDHLYFRGAIMRKFYPIPDLRSMSNIDVLVKSDCVSQVCKLLEAEKFELKQYNSGICSASKSTVTFNIHPSLSIPSKHGNPVMPDAGFQNAYMKNKNFFVLDDSYHLAYIIGNIARYITTQRCSIRPICDVAVFSYANKDNIDWEKVEYLLKEHNLWDFAVFLFSCCTEYFFHQSYVPYKDKANTEIICEFLDFLLQNGAQINSGAAIDTQHTSLLKTTQNRIADIFSKKTSQDKNLIDFLKKIGL